MNSTKKSSEKLWDVISDCERNESSVENKKFHELHSFLNKEEEILKDVLLDSYNMIQKILKCKTKGKRSLGRPIKLCKDLSVICIVCSVCPTGTDNNDNSLWLGFVVYLVIAWQIF